jgi:hypothetical protein
VAKSPNWRMRKLIWRLRLGMVSPADVRGFALGGVIVIAVAAAVLMHVTPFGHRWDAALRRVNYGFGPAWECQNVAAPGGSYPICFKKIPPTSTAAGS